MHQYSQYNTKFWYFQLVYLPTQLSVLGLLSVFILIASSTQIMSEEHKELKLVLQGNGQFTKNLYKVLAKETGNVFFSPISIHAILAMAYQGAEGKTKDAFTNVLNIPDITTAANGYAELLKRLNSVNDVTLLMANKVFLKENYKLQAAFGSIVTKSFFSEVQLLDFLKPDEAVKSINSWVERKTNDKIKDLISSGDIDQDTRLILVNAIYFKGKWLFPFNVKNTATEKFYLNENDTVDVQMMHITKKLNYKEDSNLDAKVLELPYSNKALSLVIILPNKKDGIAELEQKLAEVDLTSITENMHHPEVNVSLPKFKIEQTIDLKDSLSQIGLGEMFGKNANFSGMLDSPEQLCVSKVIQKAFIEVNEEGAEAAAATGMAMVMMAAFLPRLPEVFTVDHPFIILLQTKQDQAGNILFKGRINKPKY